MIYKDLAKKIKKLRSKLHKEINDNGINSQEARKISKDLDKLINEYSDNIEKYNSNSLMHNEYLTAYNKIKQITKEFGEFPTVKAWNKYAMENVYLSNKSIEYISGLDWNNLRSKIFAENNKKNF